MDGPIRVTFQWTADERVAAHRLYQKTMESKLWPVVVWGMIAVLVYFGYGVLAPRSRRR